MTIFVSVYLSCFTEIKALECTNNNVEARNFNNYCVLCCFLLILRKALKCTNLMLKLGMSFICSSLFKYCLATNILCGPIFLSSFERMGRNLIS